MAPFDDVVRETFNNRAVGDPSIGSVLAMHQAHANVYRDYISKVRLKAVLDPKPGDEILDFGCGIGRLATYLAPLVRKIEGVDRSEEMLKLAARNAAGGNFGNVRFQHVASSSLPFDTNSFTKVFSVWALQHTSDEEVEGVIRELHRVLKPGGRGVVIEQVEFKYRQPNSFNIHRTAAQYRDSFVKSGFRMLSYAHAFRNPSRPLSIWSRWGRAPRWVLPLLAILESVLIDRKPQFVEYYTDRFVLEKAGR